MANRDYFTRPIQGNGRDYYGYGQSLSAKERKRLARNYNRVPPMLWFAIAVMAAYFIWQFTR